MASFYFDDENDERKEYLIDLFNDILGGDIGTQKQFKHLLAKIRKKKNKNITEKNMLNYYDGVIDKQNLISEFLGEKGLLHKYYDREFKTISVGYQLSDTKSFASVKGNKVLVSVEKRLIRGEFRLILRDSKGHFAKAI